jgi:hypothetical protein
MGDKALVVIIATFDVVLWTYDLLLLYRHLFQ